MKTRLGFIWLLWCSILTAVASPVRVVSLSPALTDAVMLIGGRENLCARSRVCDAPGTASLPVAGDFGNPAVETIIRLKPDYVISDSVHPGGKWEQLKRAGIKVRFFPAEKLSDFPDNLRKLGKLLNRSDRAAREAEIFEKQLRQLAVFRPQEPPSVLIVFAVSPVVSCNKKSFIHELLNIAGAVNICADAPGRYFTVSTEYILRRSPELLLIAGVPEGMVRNYFSRPEFRHVRAIKNNRIIFVDPVYFCRMGKNLIPAIKSLRQQIYSPGAADLPSR